MILPTMMTPNKPIQVIHQLYTAINRGRGS